MNFLSKLFEVAENEVGYIEKASNSNLDDKTANAGSKNYTKYGRDLVKWIGSPYANGVAWCDEFLDWCFVSAYGKEEAYKLLGGLSAYTPTSASYFKNRGQWYSKPQAGDLIFFHNDTRICHVGLVYKVDATTVYTIEGNTSDGTSLVANGGMVCRKSYKLTYSRISGYARPKYDAETSVTLKTEKQYIYGIDVSSCQGDIDFEKVKNDGIGFVILRSTTKNNHADTKWDRYLADCDANGLDVMCYKYSYATSEDEAVREADSVIKLLHGRQMMIWYDVENTEQINKIGKRGLTLIVNAFARRCKEEGYKVGIYCNLSWWKTYVDDMLKSNYDFWIARYGKNTPTLNDSYRPNVGEIGWQYCSLGKVAGIAGNVDLDVFLVSESEMNTGTKGKVTATKLNIRSGAGTTCSIVGQYTHGTTVTILEEKNGWGRTNKGWISLKYFLAT